MTDDRFIRFPAEVKDLFWDCDVRGLKWGRDQDLIIARILTHGGLHALKWLRSLVSDRELREWILRRSGAGMNPQRLRFWEVILDLPHRRVNDWLYSERNDIWNRRNAP